MRLAKAERSRTIERSELTGSFGRFKLVARGERVGLDGLATGQVGASHQNYAGLSAWANCFELLAFHASILNRWYCRADPESEGIQQQEADQSRIWGADA